MKHSCLSVSVLAGSVVLTVLGGRLSLSLWRRPLPRIPSSRAVRCARSRCLRTRRAVRGQHAGQSPRDLRGRAPGLTHPPRCRSASSRSRSRPRTTRGLGRQPPVGQREHRRRRRRGHTARVTRTLLVGDEPRDIVFAGPAQDARVHHHRAPRPEHARSTRSSPRRASAARTSGCSTRTNLGATLGGTPLMIVTLFRDTPRALAVIARRPARLRRGVHSGNQTTIVAELGRSPYGARPGGIPPPTTNHAGVPAARGRA